MTIGDTNALARPGGQVQSDAEKVRKAAGEFEALFLAQILRNARETSSTSEDTQSGLAMMEVAEEHIARSLAEHGGLGLAQSIIENLDHLTTKPGSPKT